MPLRSSYVEHIAISAALMANPSVKGTSRKRAAPYVER